MTFLDEQIVSAATAASVTFAAISQAYRHLMIFYVARCDTTVQTLRLQFNADTGSNYDSETFVGAGNSATAGELIGAVSAFAGSVNQSTAAAGAMTCGNFFIPYYTQTTNGKNAVANYVEARAQSSGNIVAGARSGTWRTANAAVTQILLLPSSGNFVQNSRFSLYGIT